MKNKIIAKDKYHLKDLIKKEIQSNGEMCDLNHIDISQVKDLSFLFKNSNFNGNISEWDVSNVIDMSLMFYSADFNGDISKWDVSNVNNMLRMFDLAKFNGDISQWNVSNVKNMVRMFDLAKFNGDISQWDVSNVKDMQGMFFGAKFNKDINSWTPYELAENNASHLLCSEVIKPYWSTIKDKEARNKAIDAYHLNKELDNELNSNNVPTKKVKI
jgi:surface protein